MAGRLLGTDITACTVTLPTGATWTMLQLMQAVQALQAGSGGATGATGATGPAPSTGGAWPAGQTWPITVGPGQRYAEPADAIAAAGAAGALVPGFKLSCLAGTYLKPFDVPANLDGWSIAGAGAYASVFDGQGGISGGHRLAFGKAFLHAQSAGTVQGIGFTRCGGLPFDANYENQAGVYAEGFGKPGLLSVRQCAFDGCNDAIFVPPGTVSLETLNCDFGKNASNGADQSGKTHDIYVQGAAFRSRNCNHYGNLWGNNIKSRSPSTVIEGGNHWQSAGRWVDVPDCGAVSITGGIFGSLAGADSGNVLSYGEESSNNPIQNVIVSGATFYISRYNSNIWIVPAGSTWTFSGCTLNWVAANSTPPSLTNAGAGRTVGLPVPSSAPAGVPTVLPALPPTATTSAV